MKQILAVTIIVAFLASCSELNSQSQADGITISGTIVNPPVGLITVDKMLSNRTETIDTISVNDDNTFSYVFVGEAGFYRVNFYNAQSATLILDQDDLTLTFDGDNITGNLMADGSREMSQIQEFYTNLNAEYGPKEQAINIAFVKANAEGDKEGTNQARAEYMSLLKDKQAYSAELIVKAEINLSTFQLLSTLDNDNQLELKDSLAQLLNTKYPGRSYIEDLVATMDKARETAVGVLAPEISLPNPDGKITPLSSLRGQVVLVDFWAQWCKPCRMENPNVVKAYNKYKDRGFTVYGVSLDRTKEKWLQAIEEDGLTWTHVSDLKYFNSVAAQTYGITGIPFSILLDREGKIIAKNLRGDALEDALEEHFQQEGGM